MDLKIKIDNIGKLKNANISVRPLTVLAGPNNTGKSFFSKILYSVFSSVNTDPVMAEIQYHLEELSSTLHRMVFIANGDTDDQKKNQQSTPIQSINSIEEQKMKLHKVFSKRHLLASLESYPEIQQILSELLKLYNNLYNELYSPPANASPESRIYESYNDTFNTIKKHITVLEEIKNSQPEKALSNGFGRVLSKNLTGNFQTPFLRLIRDSEKPATINGTGRINIKDHKINTDISFMELAKLQNNQNVIYLESPVHWKLRNALLSASRHPGLFSSERKSLLVPKYFKDLNLMLMEELSGEMAFPDIFNDLTKKLIKGRLAVDESGTLQFKELNGKSHKLPVTATGIVQLGLLALLIEKKVLDKGTILFVDEPETNLHPSWQVKMMSILFKLMKAGARVIMATHSADMLKWLEVHLKKHPEDTKLISLNQMILQEDGTAYVESSDEDIPEQIKTIKKNLTKPFLDLFLENWDNNT